MNIYLKDFIKEHRNLINENSEESWNQLYHLILNDRQSQVDGFYVGAFTDMLLKAGINPLNKMKSVPSCFAYERFETESPVGLIPDHIIEIQEEAFSGCTFGTLYLPKELLQIRSFAFEVCSIKDLYINDKLLNIDARAFDDADIQHVYFPNLNVSWDWIVGVDGITCLYALNNTIEEVSDKIDQFNNHNKDKDFWDRVTKVKCKDGWVKRG